MNFQSVRMHQPVASVTNDGDLAYVQVGCGHVTCKREGNRIVLIAGPDCQLAASGGLRFPPPWTVEDIGGSFVVKASNERPLIFIYYRDGAGRQSLARLLTRDAARRIAANIAKLPELLERRQLV